MGDNEFMSILQSGNVGIGTTVPLAKLDTRGDVFVGLTAEPDIVSGPGNNSYLANDTGDQNNSFRLDGFGNNLYIVARSGANSEAGADIVFRTAAAEGLADDRMTIDQDGNVGIGITNPTAKLHIRHDPRNHTKRNHTK